MGILPVPSIEEKDFCNKRCNGKPPENTVGDGFFHTRAIDPAIVSLPYLWHQYISNP